MSHFMDDKLAFAGLMFLTGILGLMLGRTLNHSEAWRDVHRKCDHLGRKRLSTSFNGEISITLAKGTAIAFVAMYWTLFTLRSLKEHLYENAIDVFSVVYLAQICALIIIIPHQESGHGWKEVLTGHLPMIEIAMVAVFTYVMWRTGLHWEKTMGWFNPEILDKLEAEMRQL
jgi:hypothetical protein